MTLTKQSLKRLSDSMQLRFTEAQEHVILERFGTEPEPYEWSEQDIAEQIRYMIREQPCPEAPRPRSCPKKGSIKCSKWPRELQR